MRPLGTVIILLEIVIRPLDTVMRPIETIMRPLMIFHFEDITVTF